MIITKIITGVKTEIELTYQDLQYIERQNKIQWAKNIMENYDIIDNDVFENDDLLFQIAEEIEDKTMENNGEIEWNVLEQYGLVE